MLDALILLLIFAVIPTALIILSYKMFKRKLIKTTTKAVMDGLPDPDAPVILHGHDLSKWHYLGHSNCRYVNDDGSLLTSYPIFLFVSKTDEKRRSYYCSIAAKTHNFVETYVNTWAAGEGEVYTRIQGEQNYPSDYLKEYMLDRFGAVWDNDTYWWDTNDKAKYDSAKNKQKRKQKTEEDKPAVKVENNVVTVEFGKQA